MASKRENEFRLIINDLKNLGNEYVIAKSLEKIINMQSVNEFSRYLNGIELVFVGDNPGKTEKKENEYFVGDSGERLKEFISNFLKVDEDKCMFLEKSLLSTNKVNELRKYQDDRSQKVIAEFIKMIVKLNKRVYICFLGYTDFFNLHEKAIFSVFYNCINETVNNQINQFGVFYHPSVYRVFPNEERKLCNQIVKEFENISHNKLTEKIIFKAVGTDMLKNMKKTKKLIDYINDFKDNYQECYETQCKEDL